MHKLPRHSAHTPRCLLLILVTFAALLSACDPLPGEELQRLDLAFARKDHRTLQQALQPKQRNTLLFRRALAHLLTLQTPQSKRILLAFFAKQRWTLRHTATHLLLGLKERKEPSIQLLTRFCEDPIPQVRSTLTIGLGQRPITHPKLWLCLLARLHDSKSSIRKQAQHTLLQQGWRALPPLMKKLANAPKKAQKARIAVLRRITLRSWRKVASWQAWWKQRGKLESLQHTGRWPQARTALQQALASKHIAQRRLAARILWNLAPPQEGLQLLLQSPHPSKYSLLGLWGQQAHKPLLAFARANPHKLTPSLARTLALTAKSPKQLLPFLNPQQPAVSIAILQCLTPHLKAKHTHTLLSHPIASSQPSSRPSDRSPTKEPVLARVKALTHAKSPTLRTAAALALWQSHRLSEIDLLALLTPGLSSPKPALQIEAIEAITQLAIWSQDLDARKILLDAWHHKPSKATQKALANALYTIHAQAPMHDLRPQLLALARKHPELLGALAISLLLNMPPTERFQALAAWPAWTPARQLQLFRGLVAPIPAQARTQAQTFLTPLLTRALRHGPPRLQEGALHAIKRLRYRPLFPLLQTLAKTRTFPQSLLVPLAQSIAVFGYTRAVRKALDKIFRRSPSLTRDRDGRRWKIAYLNARAGHKKSMRWAVKVMRVRPTKRISALPIPFVFLLDDEGMLSDETLKDALKYHSFHHQRKALHAIYSVRNIEEDGADTSIQALIHTKQPAVLRWLNQHITRPWRKRLTALATRHKSHREFRDVLRFIAKLARTQGLARNFAALAQKTPKRSRKASSHPAKKVSPPVLPLLRQLLQHNKLDKAAKQAIRLLLLELAIPTYTHLVQPERAYFQRNAPLPSFPLSRIARILRPYGLCHHTIRLADLLATKPNPSPTKHNRASWNILLCPSADPKDLQRALRYAQHAVQQTRSEKAAYLNTLALAYYRLGHQRAALQTQLTALSYAPKDPDLIQRLTHYIEEIASYTSGATPP